MWAVVTGASQGIGRATCFKFAEAGFNILMCSRGEKDLSHVKGALECKFNNIKVLYKTADLTDRQQVKSFGEFVKNNTDTTDVLVNNAGTFIPGQIHSEADDVLDKMLAVNLYSAYDTTRALIGRMIDRKKGHVINICSVASFKGYERGGSYAISKAAMLGFSRSLREEMKPFNVRVSALMPGATNTASWEGSGVEEQRLMKPEDIASVIFNIWSLSEQSVVEEVIVRPFLGDV